MTKFLNERGLIQLVSGFKDYIETRFDNVFKRRILEANNPIGTVREFYVPTNPATLLGFGTWEQISQGRALTGVDTSDSDFSYAGKTGGKKTHLLTKDEVPTAESTQVEKLGAYGTWVADTSYKSTAAEGHNILSPYYCVYVWRRKA